MNFLVGFLAAAVPGMSIILIRHWYVMRGIRRRKAATVHEFDVLVAQLEQRRVRVHEVIDADLGPLSRAAARTPRRMP